MMFKRLTYGCLLVVLVAGCSDSPIDSPSRDHLVRVPDDASTIQAAIDRAQIGDTVLVAPGDYIGTGNRDIDFRGKSIALVSEQGPLATRIFCYGASGEMHAGFTGIDDVTDIVIDGFTVSGARGANGAVLNLTGTSPTIRNCIFSNNRATASGGAVRCKNASPTFVNCTLVQNGAPAGGAVYLLAGSSPRFENCLIAFSSEGGAIGTHGGASPEFSCSNIYGNRGGDWTGAAAGHLDADGNVSIDPEFAGEADYRLLAESPCLPDNNECGELIGAVGAR